MGKAESGLRDRLKTAREVITGCYGNVGKQESMFGREV